tara:strand:- start:245 stop:454 length:210 start_codon:yes stop_codon:yes gene_type:complete
MNNNDELISKCLDTLEPKWLSAVVAVITEDGVEFELFSKTSDVHEQVVLLSTVSAGSVVELDKLLGNEN